MEKILFVCIFLFMFVGLLGCSSGEKNNTENKPKEKNTSEVSIESDDQENTQVGGQVTGIFTMERFLNAFSEGGFAKEVGEKLPIEDMILGAIDGTEFTAEGEKVKIYEYDKETAKETIEKFIEFRNSALSMLNPDKNENPALYINENFILITNNERVAEIFNSVK